MAAAVPERPAPALQPYREPPCLNCGAPAGDAYCPRCGQETRKALPSAREFLRDAAGRYVALDGRLWRTLAALLFHPGFLTREYFGGRRRRYVRPARLFLVLSLAMFAIIRLSIGDPEIAQAVVLDPPARVDGTAGPAQPESLGLVLPGVSLSIDDDGKLDVGGGGPFASLLRDRLARFNALPRQARLEQLVLGTLRYGPYAMFALLPAFAFLLMAVYAGRARRHPHRPRRYAEHLVFAAHNHAFFFLVVALAVAVPWPPVRAALLLWTIPYALWSLRAVYGGRWIGLLARAWMVGVAYIVLFGLATAGLLVAAVVIR
jgi:hypothetical protein